jgi:hypothetical protein
MATGATIKRGAGGLKALTDRLKEARRIEVVVGFPAGKGQPYPDGTPVVQVASEQVFGIGVVQRDFMALARPKIIERAKPILAQIVKIVSSGNANDVATVDALFRAVGEMGIAEIRATIVDGGWPPNSSSPMGKDLRERVSKSWGIDVPAGMSYLEAKMKYRGSDKPLVDTGHLVQSVTADVRERS